MCSSERNSPRILKDERLNQICISTEQPYEVSLKAFTWSRASFVKSTQLASSQRCLTLGTTCRLHDQNWATNFFYRARKRLESKVLQDRRIVTTRSEIFWKNANHHRVRRHRRVPSPILFRFVSDENETISLIPLHLPELFRFQLSPINRKLLREPEKEEVKSQQCGKTLDWNLFFQQDNLTQGWSNSNKTRVLAPRLRK